MRSITATGLGAGLTSALLFASVISGSPLAVVLFYAAALPVMIAAMGWSHRAGLVAAVAGTAVLGVWLGPPAGIAYALGVAVPAWLLAYFALLGRTDETGTVREWFPTGSLVALAALLGAGLGAVAVLVLGASLGSDPDGLRGMLEAMLREEAGTPQGQPLVVPGISDVDRLVQLLVVFVPPGAVAVWTLTTLLNLWLAAKVSAASGRLKRPWPAPGTLRLPRWSLPVLVAAAVLVALPGTVGLLGRLLLATEAVAFMVLGFSTLHALTAGVPARAVILAGAYLSCVLWIVIPMLALVPFAVFWLAVAEQAVGLRARLRARRGPGPANDNL